MLLVGVGVGVGYELSVDDVGVYTERDTSYVACKYYRQDYGEESFHVYGKFLGCKGNAFGWNIGLSV